MSTKAKLIIAMIVIGGAIAAINTALIFVYQRDQAQSNVEQTEASNKQRRTSLEEQIADEGDADTKAELEAELAGIKDPGWIDSNDYLVMTAWIVVAQFGMLAAAAIALWRRDESLPLTWGEAVFYGFVAFGYLIIVNGFIPHYIIKIWDVNVAATPFTVWPTRDIAQLWNENALGWQWNWRAVRDMIVAGWYIVTLLLMYIVWYWAQEYPKRQAQREATADSKSPYGRPMLSAEK